MPMGDMQALFTLVGVDYQITNADPLAMAHFIVGVSELLDMHQRRVKQEQCAGPIRQQSPQHAAIQTAVQIPPCPFPGVEGEEIWPDTDDEYSQQSHRRLQRQPSWSDHVDCVVKSSSSGGTQEATILFNIAPRVQPRQAQLVQARTTRSDDSQ